MSETINIQEILKNNNIYPDFEGDAYYQAIINTIKQSVEAAIDKCAEEADTVLVDNISENRQEYTSLTAPSGYCLDTEVDKRSILNVKNLILYE